MPRPAAVATAPTPERFDELVNNSEASLSIIGQAMSSGEYEQENRDPSIGAAEQNLKSILGTMRDTMAALLKEHEAGRPGLLTTFGRDAAAGERLERVRGVLDSASYVVGAEDGPLATCLDHLQSLEAAMEAALEPAPACDLPPAVTEAAAEEQQRAEEPEPRELPLAPKVEEDGQVVQETQEAPTSCLESTSAEELDQPTFSSKEDAIDSLVEERAANAAQREMRSETVLENGVRYTGEWLGSLRDGEGVEVRPDGSSYMGQFVAGHAHGKGVYSQTCGLTIAGRWSGGKLNGSGIETHPDGTTYEGQYKDGVKSGFGTYTYEEGSVYEGGFENDSMHGNGVYISANGFQGGRYQGDWNANRMHGNGVFKVPDGRMYSGQYTNDRRNGTGTFSWPDGRVHEGQWKGGKMHGSGRAVFPDGGEKRGLWQDGRLLRWTAEDKENTPAPVAPVGGQMKDARAGEHDASRVQNDVKVPDDGYVGGKV